jgi:hypothetical protein
VSFPYMLWFRRVVAFLYYGRPGAAEQAGRTLRVPPPALKVTMRLWSMLVKSAPEPSPSPIDLEHQVEEGYIVALSALRLSVKNGIILSIVRDGDPWNDQAAERVARAAIDTLVLELQATGERLDAESQRATPGDRDALLARSKGERARVARRRTEAERLAMRSATMHGVADELLRARDDHDAVQKLVMRARDDTLSELLQARLIPRATPVVMTEEQQREATRGVIADLQLLIDERTGY